MYFNLDLLSWFGNFLNFLIFAYISISLINTECFNAFQMSLSLIGLLSTIFIQIIVMAIREYFKARVRYK